MSHHSFWLVYLLIHFNLKDNTKDKQTLMDTYTIYFLDGTDLQKSSQNVLSSEFA